MRTHVRACYGKGATSISVLMSLKTVKRFLGQCRNSPHSVQPSLASPRKVWSWRISGARVTMPLLREARRHVSVEAGGERAWACGLTRGEGSLSLQSTRELMTCRSSAILRRRSGGAQQRCPWREKEGGERGVRGSISGCLPGPRGEAMGGHGGW